MTTDIIELNNRIAATAAPTSRQLSSTERVVQDIIAGLPARCDLPASCADDEADDAVPETEALDDDRESAILSALELRKRYTQLNGGRFDQGDAVILSGIMREEQLRNLADDLCYMICENANALEDMGPKLDAMARYFMS